MGLEYITITGFAQYKFQILPKYILAYGMLLSNNYGMDNDIYLAAKFTLVLRAMHFS